MRQRFLNSFSAMACRSRATSSAVAGIERASHEVASSRPQLADLGELTLSSYARAPTSSRRKLQISKVLELRQLAKLAAPIIITMMCHQSMVISDMVRYNSSTCGPCIESGMHIVVVARLS
jgi:hypothetical protein